MMTLGLRSGNTQAVHDSLRNRGEYHSNQAQVWDDISQLSKDTKVESPTGAMRDVYESKASSLAEYEKAFEPTPQQHGLLAFINGQVVGFDVLSRASAYQQLHPKLVKSYAMEAMQTEQSETPSISKAQAFLTATLDCTARHYTSIGYGDDHRFEGQAMVGSALVADETVIHIAFFKVADNEADGEAMAGYQQRREFRTTKTE
jgi:geranylgeranyl pyrophosphate synthase